MTQNSDAAGTDEPEDGGEWRGNEAQRNGDADERGVELGGGGSEGADLEIRTLQLANSPHSSDDEEDDEQQREVGDQAVDGQHDENDGIVAGEVAEVVVDAALDLAKVLGLGDALDVEELGDGLEVGEARGQGLRAHALEAPREVEARGEGVERNADARHDVERARSRTNTARSERMKKVKGMIEQRTKCTREQRQSSERRGERGRWPK